MRIFKALIIPIMFFSLPVEAKGEEQGDSTRYFGAVRHVQGAALAGFKVQSLEIVQHGYAIPRTHLFMTLEGSAVIEDQFGGRIKVGPYTNLKISETGVVLEKGTVFITDLAGKFKLPSGVILKAPGSEGIVRFQPQHGDFNILALTGEIEVLSAAENLRLKPGYFVTGKDYKAEWAFPEKIALSSAGEQIDFFDFTTSEKERLLSYIKVTRFAEKRNVAMNKGHEKSAPAQPKKANTRVQEAAPVEGTTARVFADEIAEIKEIQKESAKAVEPKKPEPELLLTDSGRHAQGVNPGNVNEFKSELVQMKKKRMGWRYYLPEYKQADVEITDIRGISQTATQVGYIDSKVVNEWRLKTAEELQPPKESTVQQAKSELMDYLKNTDSNESTERMPASLPVHKKTQAPVVTVPVQMEPRKLDESVAPVNSAETLQWKEKTPMGVRADGVISVHVPTPDRLRADKNKGPVRAAVKAVEKRKDARAPASLSSPETIGSPYGKDSAKHRLIQKLKSFKSYYITDEDRRRQRITQESERAPASVNQNPAVNYNDGRQYGEPTAPDLSENF